MTAVPSPPVLVLIVGPQASGKSSLAAALADALRDRGEAVALVALDSIAAMALPTLPDWDVAHRIFASVVGQWTGSRLACVVAEGAGSLHEASMLRRRVPAGAPVLTVAVTASFPVAFARAQQDRSRGISRDHDCLADVYERWSAELPRLDADVVIDTDDTSVQQRVRVVRAAIERARRAPDAER